MRSKRVINEQDTAAQEAMPRRRCPQLPEALTIAPYRFKSYNRLNNEALMNSGRAFLDALLGVLLRRKQPRLLLPGRSIAPTSADLVEAAKALLSLKGRTSGTKLSAALFQAYAGAPSAERGQFFKSLADEFGVETEKVKQAAEAFSDVQSDEALNRLIGVCEPRRQELFRRLNLAEGGTLALVRMREDLIEQIDKDPKLRVIDRDFVHLFSSWFNRGFLVLKQIDWDTPASILEKLIRYEAVHKIGDWTDLKRRLEPRDRRCFAFFHPALADEPLIFVEVALTAAIPASIDTILRERQQSLDPSIATTAVFYSISNCQKGLAGVSFGNFLIKQVVEHLSYEFKNLKTFVTLSPVPRFAMWLNRALSDHEVNSFLSEQDRSELQLLSVDNWWQQKDLCARLEAPLMRAACYYFLREKSKSGLPYDHVARFHLGNGASLERINVLGDTSEKGISNAHGLMVNYLYSPNKIERNHELFSEGRQVVVGKSVRKLEKKIKSKAITRRIKQLIGSAPVQSEQEIRILK